MPLLIGWLISWLIDQRSTVAGGLAIGLLAVTLVLRYGFDLWWPFGIVMATVFALIAIFASGRE